MHQDSLMRFIHQNELTKTFAKANGNGAAIPTGTVGSNPWQMLTNVRLGAVVMFCSNVAFEDWAKVYYNQRTYYLTIKKALNTSPSAPDLFEWQELKLCRKSARRRRCLLRKAWLDSYKRCMRFFLDDSWTFYSIDPKFVVLELDQ